MKAAIINRFGEADLFQISDIEIPEYNANEVLIRVNASSINPVDWKHRKGNHRLLKGSNFPIVLGYDAAGIIEEKGSSVFKYNIGDRVNVRLAKNYGGAYAEFAVANKNLISLIPEGVNYSDAAALPLAGGTALQGLRDFGNIKKNQSVLINGAASGVGHLAVQIAKNYGAKVTAICSTRHESLIEYLKPDRFVDYKQIDIKTLDEKYDIIFDIVGTESFLSLKHLLNPNGTYISTLPRPKILFHKFISVFTQGLKAKTFLMKSNGKDLDLLNQMVAEKKLRVFIDKSFQLDEIAEAHKYSESGMAEGKIVIRISD